MNDLPLLSVLVFLPLVGALFILVMKGSEATVANNARNVALWISFLTFALSLVLWLNFDVGQVSYQYVEKSNWVKDMGVQYHLGVDGISLFFILLTTFLTPLCILASWESVTFRVREYMMAFLLLETFLVGMFCALDLVLFYVFFEGVLIPMFLIIGIWGGERRIYSCFKFFLYTFLGSILMLVAILSISYITGSTDLSIVRDFNFSLTAQKWLWLAFFASFAVKVPMWPVHTWLPDAHVEAPTAGSVILAGILLKMGAYGFLRFSIPLFPGATIAFTPMIMALSVIAIIYASLVALAQTDIKKLIAYSSVAHMGLVTLGIFTLTTQGVSGAILQMLSHGIVAAALFLCVGVVYDRLHTRDIDRYGGLVARMPIYALFFMIFTFAAVGFPGTSGFVGEFLVFVGAFQVNTGIATLAVLGMVLGPAYALWLYRRMIFGKLAHADLKAILDLNIREAAILGSLAGLVLWLGLYPQPFLNIINPAVKELVANHQSWGREGISLAQATQKERSAIADSGVKPNSNFSFAVSSLRSGRTESVRPINNVNMNCSGAPLVSSWGLGNLGEALRALGFLRTRDPCILKFSTKGKLQDHRIHGSRVLRFCNAFLRKDEQNLSPRMTAPGCCQEVVERYQHISQIIHWPYPTEREESLNKEREYIQNLAPLFGEAL